MYVYYLYASTHDDGITDTRKLDSSEWSGYQWRVILSPRREWCKYSAHYPYWCGGEMKIGRIDIIVTKKFVQRLMYKNGLDYVKYVGGFQLNLTLSSFIIRH